MKKKALIEDAQKLFAHLTELDEDERIDAINEIRQALHEHSPMKHHPVDCVLWIKQNEVQANAYNPNAVAPPEMKLLERSIQEDGYTQPVVVWKEDEHYEIIDGYHRSLVARSLLMYSRVSGRLPVAVANEQKTSLPDRMASTIRHNRARGTHSIDLMQNIVAELVDAGMSDQWIMKHIGMDLDELLRLKQLTGLAALFKNQDFSRSWLATSEVEDAYVE